MMRVFWIAWVLFLPLVSGTQFEATAEPVSLKPGGLVTLELKRRGALPGKVEWVVPHDALLRRVALEELPVRLLDDGRYESGQRWVLQAVRSGDVALKGMEARFAEGGVENVVSLNELSLSVEPLSEAATHDEPEPWPDSGGSRAGGGLWWPSVLVAVLVALATLIMVARSKESGAEERSPQGVSPFEVLRRRLEGQSMTRGDLQHFLIHHGAECSPAFRTSLEAAAYSNRPDEALLLEALKKEVDP